MRPRTPTPSAQDDRTATAASSPPPLQSFSLLLDGITAGDYLAHVRDAEPLALGRELRWVGVDSEPLGDRIDVVLQWDREPPPPRTAALVAGFRLIPEVAAVTVPQSTRANRLETHHSLATSAATARQARRGELGSPGIRDRRVPHPSVGQATVAR